MEKQKCGFKPVKNTVKTEQNTLKYLNFDQVWQHTGKNGGEKRKKNLINSYKLNIVVNKG